MYASERLFVFCARRDAIRVASHTAPNAQEGPLSIKAFFGVSKTTFRIMKEDCWTYTSCISTFDIR
jgi:hypothetical protein